MVGSFIEEKKKKKKKRGKPILRLLHADWYGSHSNGALTAVYLYSRTSMARTSLRPWKFVLDIGSSAIGG